MNRRSRIVALLGCCLALGGALVLLQRQHGASPRESAPEAVADPLAEVETRLANRLARAEGDTLVDAWVVVRALGPRAPLWARQRVARAATAPEGTEPLPEWAGSEPQLALTATLLETDTADRRDGATLDRWVHEGPPATDPFTLAWRIEYLALLGRSGHSGPWRKLLARELHAALKRLGRGLDPGSLEYAWLARAAFKAASLAGGPEQTSSLQRSVARMLAARESGPPRSPLLAATSLEALASYALLQQASAAGASAAVKNTVTRERARLARPDAELDLPAASATLRALRLSRVALRDTNSVFTQYGETLPAPAHSAPPTGDPNPAPLQGTPLQGR